MSQIGVGTIRHRTAVWSCRLLIIALVLTLMMLAPGRWVSTFAVASPDKIFVELRTAVGTSDFYRALGETVVHAVVPLVASAILGVLTAWVLWLLPKVRRVLESYFAVAYATPRVIFLPLFILWFGSGEMTVYVYVTIACYFIFVFNTLEGFVAKASDLVDVLKIVGLNRLQMLTTYLLPACRDYLLAAALIAFPTAVLGAIIAEMIVGGGVGGWIMAEKAVFSTPGLYAATLTATVFAAVLNLAVQKFGARMRDRMGLT